MQLWVQYGSSIKAMGGAASLGYTGHVQCLVHISLADVFVHRIVGDEANATVLVALRV